MINENTQLNNNIALLQEDVQKIQLGKNYNVFI